MTIITSATYINPELQVEFGKLPPVFLPLGAKRLYEHQIELFKKHDDSIVLSLPSSFELSHYDRRKLEKYNVEIVYVKEGLSLGESIIFVLNMLLPINETVSILHGDTLFTEISNENTESSFLISSVATSYNWEYIVNDGSIFIEQEKYDKNELESYVLSGFFTFQNIYEFMRCLVQKEYTFSKALKLYAKREKTSLIKNDHWLDFGLASTYFHSRKSFTTERAFNSLKIENGYVEKCSEKVGKLQSEIEWFKSISSKLDLYLPRFEVLQSGECYKTEYLYLNTLSELFVFGKLPSYIWKQIFRTTKYFLNTLHEDLNFQEKVNFDYKKKTLARLKDFCSKQNIELSHAWKYNTTSMPSLEKIIEELDKYLPKNEKVAFIHGDFCMSNIMYDFKSDSIKVYDPRGMDFDNKVTPYGTTTYDYAKLTHSVVGLYDFIISGFYELEYRNYDLRFEIHSSDQITKIGKAFFEVYAECNIQEIYAVMIHLFLSMLPLHDDNEKKQYALLANAFRLYIKLTEDDL